MSGHVIVGEKNASASSSSGKMPYLSTIGKVVAVHFMDLARSAPGASFDFQLPQKHASMLVTID